MQAYLIGFTSLLLSPVLNLYLRLFDPQNARFLRLDARAARAFRRGDDSKAAALASEALQLVDNYVDDWNYGNVIHDSHQILGLVSLRSGNMEQARAHLLAAGSTPGSPQLASFGPKMILARALLEKGETQVVAEYLELVAKFWAAEKDSESREYYRRHKQLLQEWQADIAAGRIPKYWLWRVNI